MKFQAPEAVLEIARRLDAHGHQVWAVGGAVRDALAGRPGGDWDLATDAHPDRVRRIFRRTVPLGLEHGTVGVLARDGVLYEVTTFRKDVETDGRHAVVAFAASLDEDLARRDFTFNAIAWDPLRDELRDPWQGVSDLRARVLRTVGDPAQRFAEDFLRILRALRFAGHFGMTIEAATWDALVAAVPQLHALSAERIREEITKVLARTDAAAVTLQLYQRSGALAALLPELAATVGLDMGEGPELDAWTLSLRATDALPRTRTTLRWVTLLHALGLPAARTRDLRGGWRFTGHERLGARKAEEVLQRLRFSNAETERITRLILMQSALFPPDAPDAGIRRWLAHVTPSYVNDLFRLRMALWRAHPVRRGDRDLLERWRRARAVLGQRPVLTLSDLAVNGHDLRAAGIEPGPGLGQTLRTLLDHVIEEPELNRRETLLEMVRRERAG